MGGALARTEGDKLDRALAAAHRVLTVAATILLVKLALDGYWLLALLAGLVILRPVCREVRHRGMARRGVLKH